MIIRGESPNVNFILSSKFYIGNNRPHHREYSKSELKFLLEYSGFEILEHLVSPYPLLRALKPNKLFVTVPLSLWFSKAYKSKNDPRDRHFHEFEEWQFDWLLEKAGWKVIKKEKWTNPSFKLGLRPILRNFHNRYYAVYAERDKSGRWPSKDEYTNYYRGILNL